MKTQDELDAELALALEAWRQLRRVIEKVPTTELWMGYWVCTEASEHHPHSCPPGSHQPRSRMHSCGTVACAMGWAAMDSWFNDHGLEIEMDSVGEGAPVLTLPDGTRQNGFRAATAVFAADKLSLPPHTPHVSAVFTPSSYAGLTITETKAQLLENIDNILEANA